MERRQDRLKLSCHIVCPDKSCLSVISISKQIIYQKRKKNLPCNKSLIHIPPYHKHIEARMNMVRKTAKQFYIKKYSLSDVGIFLFSHLVAKALSSALQGLTSVFGKCGLRKAPLFGERTSDGAIRERIARSALNERSPRGRGVDPLRHQHQLLIM